MGVVINLLFYNFYDSPFITVYYFILKQTMVMAKLYMNFPHKFITEFVANNQVNLNFQAH